MKYRNTITGTLLETQAEISGGGWVRADKPAPAPAQGKKEVKPKQTPTKRRK